MTSGRYASWENGIPICPECKGTRFDVAIRELVSYPIDVSKPPDSMHAFHNHEHIENCESPLAFAQCSSCLICIVLTDKLIEFLEDYI